jgi:phage-related protein
MADITDDFGRVNSVNSADLESLAKSLKSAVGAAVKYMTEQSKGSSDLGSKIKELAESMEKLGDDVRDSVKSTKEFVEKVVKAADSISKQKEERKSGLDSIAKTQSEHTKVLAAILRSQQKAQSDKVAKYTTGGASLGSVIKKRPALADMGFKPRGTDKVPAMLSPGEFIVNRKGTQGNERILNSINKGYRLGGKVKPAYLKDGSSIPGPKGSRPVDSSGEIRLTVEFEDMKRLFSEAGEEAAQSFSTRFDKSTREKMAKWATGVSSLLMGGHSFSQILFSGAVRDAFEFRVEMRELAFQTQGITGDLRGLQAEFANLGNSIVSETGKSVDVLQRVYIKNLKKGFQENKGGLKTMKSGLFLSTMIGSEAESTADLFGDWYRTLRLSAEQMDTMAFNMKDVARMTGVTGDELLGAMKSSEGLLKNLKNQGNLTTGSAKALIQIMAEAKKSGTEETTGRVLEALTSTNKLLNADAQTQNLVYSVAGRMGPESTQKALSGTLMETREDRNAFANNLMGIFGDFTNGAVRSLADFDKLDEKQRMQLTLRLQSMGLEIDEAKELYKQLKKSSAPMKERLAEIDQIANSPFATDQEKKLAKQQKSELYMSESMGSLSKFREKSSKMGVDQALSELSMDKDFQAQMKDFSGMSGALTDSMKRQFGLSGSEAQIQSQMAGMKDEKKLELSSLISANQAANVAKEKGIEYKDFGPDMAKALERGDGKAFSEAYDNFITERKKLDTQLEADTDPTKALTKTMSELNETIRNYTSSLVGGLIDLLGALGLFAAQLGFQASALVNTFGGVSGISNLFMGLMDSENYFLKQFGKEFSESFTSGKGGLVSSSFAGIKEVMTRIPSAFRMGAFSGLQKAIGPAVLLLGAIKGVMESSEAKRTRLEGGILGALTGGAKTGSFMSSTLGVKEGSGTDKALGVAGAAGWGAMAGAAIGASLAPFTAGLSIPAFAAVGAVVGGIMEVVKIITEGTDILQQIFKPFQVIVDYVYQTFKNIYDVIAGIFTLDFGRVFGAIFNQIGSTIALIPRLIMGVLESIFIGLPKLILRALSMIWELPRMLMDSIKNALVSMVDNSWVGPIFKVFSDAFNMIYDGFMAIWTPISQIFSGLYKVFDDLGKALFGAGEGGGILSGIMWVLQKAVYAVSYVISWLIAPLKVFAWALGFVLKIIGGLISAIIAPFQYLYDVLVGHSIIPDLVFGIIKFFAMLPLRIMESLLKLPIYLAKALLSLHAYVGQAIMGIGSAILSGMKAVFLEFPNYLWNGLTSLASSDWFGPIFEPFLSVLSPLKDAMADLYGAFAEIGSAFSEIGNVFYEVYAVVQESLGSLLSAISSIFSPITSMFAGTEKSAKSAFGVMDALKSVIWVVSKVIGTFLKIALFPLQVVIKIISIAISNVAKVIKGLVDILAGIFTLDGSRIWKGISGIGQAIWDNFTALPKFLFGTFKKIPTFAFKMFKKIFVEFPVWLLSTLKDGLLALPGVLLSVVKLTFVKLPIYIWDGLKWAFGKLWDWIKSWIPQSVRGAVGNVASGYGSNAEQQYETWDKEGPRTTRALGGIVGGLADIASLDIWQGLKKMAYGTAEGVHAQGQNVWEGMKAVGSYLNPFSYFQEGTRHIEKPGLAMLHQGEMVVPASLVQNIAAQGSGKFGKMTKGAVAGEGIVEGGFGVAENVVGVLDEGVIGFLEKNVGKVMPKMMKQGISAMGGVVSKVGSGLLVATKGLAKAAPVLAPMLAGINGAFQAQETGRSTLEAGLLGAVTGDAKTGSMFSSWLGVKEGSNTDKALGVLGAGATGAMTGAALGSMVPVIGTAVGGVIGGILGTGGEFYKILTEKPNAETAKVNPDVAMATDKMDELMKATSASVEKTSALMSTAVGQHAIPVLKPEAESVNDVQPIHLRDITDSILRERAGSGGSKLQSDELSRMEEASYRQVEELEQIREGIREMVSLLKPRGSSTIGDGAGTAGRTRDPKRPLHAANFGKMKYGKVGGNANRSLVNNGES